MKLKIIILFLLIYKIGLAQDTIPKKIYHTLEVDKGQAPKIDGKITDGAWNLVNWSGNYIQWSPNEGIAPSQQTSMKILYDKKNMYVAFKCYDTDPSSIVKRLSRRDGFDGDWVEINIASLGDERTAYSFTISVSGVKGEEYITNNGANWDNTWNPIWYAKTNIDSEGWTAEIRIPLSQVRFSKAANQIWGIQSTRRYFKKEERSVWQRSPQNVAGWVSSFGELHGLKNLQQQKQLEIQPYVVSSLKTYKAEPNNPFLDGRDFKLDGGVDGKLGITNDLTLDFTMNPDFGQVEADPSAIALDGFQIFFPEQRPFFIENKNIFNYNFSQSRAWLATGGVDNLFYSRRIGRSPQGYANTGSNEYSTQPNVSTILGAAKFSGKTKNGWSIGVLESVTAKESAEISDGSNIRNEVVEPLTNYFVGRIQKDFNNNNTFVGGVFTAVHRDLTQNLNFLHQSAYTGGLDLTHQWKNRKYYLKGNLVFSDVNGSSEAIVRTQQSIGHLFQREDADHLEVDDDLTSLTGSGGNLQFGKASGNWRYEVGSTWRSPELELNDIGFQLRADDIRHYIWTQYRTTKPLKKLRSWALNYTQLGVHDFQGNFNEFTLRINGFINFKNNWFVNGGTIINPRRLSNSALRGGPRLRRPGWYDYQIGLISDNRKKFRLNLNYRDLRDINAKNNYREIRTSFTYQPTNALQFSFSPFYSKSTEQLQYITKAMFVGESRYINGTISQQTLQFPLRLDYILKPNLSIQYWGQPFISKGEYKSFKYITNPVAKNFKDRFETYDLSQIESENGRYLIDENTDGITDYSFSKPDFSFVQWRSNLVLRWEYIPGSELYLVWSQDIAKFGDIQDRLFEGLEQNLLHNQPQNIFLVKATYRFMK